MSAWAGNREQEEEQEGGGEAQEGHAGLGVSKYVEEYCVYKI